MRQELRDMHQLQELVRLYRDGVPVAKIAKTLNLDRKTERKYRRRIDSAGLLEGSVDDLPLLKALKTATHRVGSIPEQERSTVEEYRSFIEEKFKLGLKPTAIHELLLEDRTAFTGSLSSVKRMYSRIRKEGGPRAEDVAILVHTAAGDQAQVDFGYVGKLYDPETKRKRKAWVFVMVLSHSRMIFAQVVFSQNVETWLELHRQSFRFFGGVPNVVVPDNLKAAVIRAAFLSDETGEVNRTYREFARYYGFMIDPTPAYSPEKKGKVESAVKYVKNSFFQPRVDRLTEISETNRRLKEWVVSKANCRVHGTTGKRPSEVFSLVEQPALRDLPESPYVPILWRLVRVDRTSHISFEGRFYSVPWKHINQDVWLKRQGNRLAISYEEDEIATHRTNGKTRYSTKPHHLPEERRDLALRDPEVWYVRAEAIAPSVRVYAEAIMASDEVVYPLRRLQSIILKLEKLPTERAQSVVAHAARYGCYQPERIARIIGKNRDLEKTVDSYVDPDWATSSTFARDAKEFLMKHEGTHGCT